MRIVSLRARVVGGGVAVVAVVLIALNLIVSITFRTQLLGDLEDLLDDRAALAQQLAPSVSIEDLVERLDGSGVHAVARLRDGSVIRSEPADLGVPAPPVGDDGGPLSRDVQLDSGHIVRLSAQERADDTLRRLIGPYLIATLLGIAVAGILLWRSTTRAMRPLDTVVEVADRIKDGNTGWRLAPDRTDTELGRMAHAFDEMLDALETALAEAQASDERSRRFLAEAAHQLRTPLAGIQASAEALPSARTRAEREQLLANLAREAARAGRRVRDLLRVVRLDQGDQPTRRPQDLAALCREEVARTTVLAPHLAVRLHGEDAIVMPIDPDAVREALANLVDNARRHATTHIDIELRATDEDCYILVTDDGPGLADPERSFERFVSLDGHGGSGLGLTIARGIARSHGGDLTYERPAFIIRLPKAASSKEDRPAAPHRASTRPAQTAHAGVDTS